MRPLLRRVHLERSIEAGVLSRLAEQREELVGDRSDQQELISALAVSHMLRGHGSCIPARFTVTTEPSS